jgi:hypothetical protein
VNKLSDKPVAFAPSAAERIRQVVLRVERQPYVRRDDYKPRAIGGPIGNFYCNLAASISGFSGTWTGGSSPSSLAPGTGTADVYQNQAGALVKVASGATINNFYKSPTTAGQVLKVTPNGDGTFDIDDQSCT